MAQGLQLLSYSLAIFVKGVVMRTVCVRKSTVTPRGSVVVTRPSPYES